MSAADVTLDELMAVVRMYAKAPSRHNEFKVRATLKDSLAHTADEGITQVPVRTLGRMHDRIAELERALAASGDLLSIAKRWAALDAGAWNAERHAQDKTELLADTLAAIERATA